MCFHIFGKMPLGFGCGRGFWAWHHIALVLLHQIIEGVTLVCHAGGVGSAETNYIVMSPGGPWIFGFTISNCDPQPGNPVMRHCLQHAVGTWVVANPKDVTYAKCTMLALQKDILPHQASRAIQFNFGSETRNCWHVKKKPELRPSKGMISLK